MNFLGLVDSSTIRGILGVAEQELPDTVFSETLFGQELQTDIQSWLSETIADVLTNASIGTTGYPAKAALLKLHAKYRGAQQVSDGQDTFNRSAAQLDKLLEDVTARALAYKEDLLALYQAASESPDLFGSARPSYDPVTDETS